MTRGRVLRVVDRLLLSDPGGGGGLVWASARSQPPTHPPIHPPTQPYPPPGGGGLCPPPAVTHKHLKICGTTEQN